ncbi:MAG: DUF1844 domain-containing protein [Phycisphaerae bacterium]|nr:DUF1844 domain-containing protein [Phycisphaerae bacterium]
MTDDKKIIHDEDWKGQAKKEKEKLDDKAQPQQVPPANMMTLINSLVLQALLYMGKLVDPNDPQAKPQINLEAAKHHIDMLEVLEEKTIGNLGDEEKQSLSLALHEMRMMYVQTASV